MIKRILPNIFLMTWSVAALGATIAHVFFTERVANASVWGLAPGWQREIGFFDLILASTAIYSVMRQDSVLKRYLCLMLPSLCIFLGSNHLVAYLQTSQVLHAQWAFLNVLAIGFGFASYAAMKEAD
jgi:hypothetical protein